jgi:NADH:ubiquinone oxidoreductase subunit K
MIKNKHKSGIIIFISPKIMTNSVKMYLGISWPFTEVELKIYLIFATKIIKAEIA